MSDSTDTCEDQAPEENGERLAGFPKPRGLSVPVGEVPLLFEQVLRGVPQDVVTAVERHLESWEIRPDEPVRFPVGVSQSVAMWISTLVTAGMAEAIYERSAETGETLSRSAYRMLSRQSHPERMTKVLKDLWTHIRYCQMMLEKGKVGDAQRVQRNGQRRRLEPEPWVRKPVVDNRYGDQD